MVQTALRLLGDRRRLHFVGISGAGMSALAEILLDRGHQVTGCDARPGEGAERIAGLGARVLAGHSPDHLDDDGGLVVSSAIPPEEPEVAQARARGIPVVRRAELLGAIMAGARGIGVAGTHGKSTTTTMTGAVLEAGGLDPTVVVGGRIRGRGGNVRIGRGEWLVAEADEYDRSFLALHPEHAVVTNLEADHLDVYGTVEAVRAAFAEYVGQVATGGAVVVGADDPGATALEVPPGRDRITFGIDAAADVRAEGIEVDGMRTRFGLALGGAAAVPVEMAMPGRHNVRNALAAAAVGWRVGVDGEAIAAGLATVRGVGRRFELMRDDGVSVVDDYAHHPTEVAAALATARAVYPGRRLVAVFQPHLYSRTRDFAAGFGEALAAADLAFVTAIYPARERPIPGVTGELVAEAARAAGGAEVVYLPDALDPAVIAARLEPADVVLTMGAGDVDKVARWLSDDRGLDAAPAGEATA